ncbi:SsrA-binding protein SmpB [Christensenellaceae bacterium OttesenSCG-928-K19]|nr:SsrA-binding protein SmpB [Christensenellaceae bacterium OttesenSCG-928-K19]
MDMKGVKVLAQNKKARHEYFIEDRYEAGLSLVGTEVKSCRMGKVNLRDSYAQVKNAEAWVHNMHISPYEKGNIFNRDPLRVRKLLLHKKEITKLLGLTAQKGYTLIPLSIYLKNGKVKLELGVCRGKHTYDKRQDLKEKATRRDMERALKN